MDINYISYSAVALSYVVFILLVTIYGLKMLNWLWFRPKRIEKWMRQQGFDGTSYRFLVGDTKEVVMMSKEALSKPINFSHDIVPRLLPFVHESVQKYGKNYFFWLGPKLTALISDPEMVKEILSKNYVFHKPSSPINDLLALGVAAYEMDKWAKHRKLINPAFNLEKLKNMLPSFYLSCCDMLSKWEEIVSKNDEGNFCEIDVWPYLQTLTSEVISRTAFGSNYEQGRKIFELQRQQGALLSNAFQLLTIPGWRVLPTKTNIRLKQNKKEVESLILEIINKRIKAIESGEANTDDLLGILLESNFKEIQENGNEFGLSLQEVIEECKLFYIAGQETTSSLLVWTMILLSKHLDWQARARAEVLQVFTSEKPDFHELNHLKIVTMILQEVLRLYPPAILLARTIHKETKLRNVTLPAGIDIILSTISVQHDCTLWGDDAKEFNPERFSEGVLKATNGQFIYFPFGGGPRICIGQNFAMLEAKMCLAMILLHYSFELSPSYAHGPDSVLTLQPQYGAHLILHKL